jgi:CheY-like chemotaxis protein
MNQPPTLHRILVVDSDGASREFVARLLEAPARSVEGRDTARAALEFLRHNPVDVVVVGLALAAGTAGVRFAQQVAECCPRARLLVLSAPIRLRDEEAIQPVRRLGLAGPAARYGAPCRVADLCETE